MRAHCLKAGVWLCTLSLVSIATAQTNLPPDQIIYYALHEIPTDPNSAVVFDVVVALTAQERNNESIGWAVEWIEFRNLSTNVPKVWFKAAPAIATPDELWWILHQNANEPQIGEFLLPPLLTGIAPAVDPEDANLQYALQGSTNQPSGPFEHTAALTYSFRTPEFSVAFKEGTDEPVETDTPEGGLPT
jgi:hypothetical protein